MMLARLLTRIYLNLARFLSRGSPVTFTEILKAPKQILLHLPPGAGEPWFALSAIDSIRHHYRGTGLSILVPAKRETLFEESLEHLILYGKLTPLSRSFLDIKRNLRGRDFDIFIDLNLRADLNSLVLSLLSRARVRVGYRGRNGFPFFNCQVPAGDGDEVGRNLSLLRRIGMETRERELHIRVSRENKKGAGTYLRSHGLRGRETLFGLTLDPGDGRRNWSPAQLSTMLKRIERLFHPRFLVFHPPIGKRFDEVWRPLRKEPIFPGGLSLSKSAGVLSYCRAFITGKTDLFPIAYGLGVPTILVLSKREAEFYSPPHKECLRVIEVKREGDLPVEKICKLALELVKP